MCVRQLSVIKNNYYDELDDNEEIDDEDENFCQIDATDLACAGARVGGEFEHTSELKTLKYREEMASGDRKKMGVRNKNR